MFQQLEKPLSPCAAMRLHSRCQKFTGKGPPLLLAKKAKASFCREGGQGKKARDDINTNKYYPGGTPCTSIIYLVVTKEPLHIPARQSNRVLEMRSPSSLEVALSVSLFSLFPFVC